MISADDVPPCANNMFSEYELDEDYTYSYIGGPSCLSSSLSSVASIPYGEAKQMQNFEIVGEEDGTEVSGLVCRRYKSKTGWSIVKYFQYDSVDDAELSGSEWYAIAQNGHLPKTKFSAEVLESTVDEQKNVELLSAYGAWI